MPKAVIGNKYYRRAHPSGRPTTGLEAPAQSGFVPFLCMERTWHGTVLGLELLRSAGNGNTHVRINSRPPRCSHIRAPRRPLLGRILDMSAGSESVCALYTDGLVSCWGCGPPFLWRWRIWEHQWIRSLSAPSPRSSVIAVDGAIRPDPSGGDIAQSDSRPVGWGPPSRASPTSPLRWSSTEPGALKYDGTSTPIRTITVRLQGPNGPMFLPIDVMSMPASSRHGVVMSLGVRTSPSPFLEGCTQRASRSDLERLHLAGADLRCWGSGSHYLSGSSSAEHRRDELARG